MILADTGFWLALANSRDHMHERATEAFGETHEELLTTWPVMTETCHLLAHRLGPDAALSFVRTASAGAFEIFQLEAEHIAKLPMLMHKYRDLPMDLADASLIFAAEYLGHGRIFSTDRRDFETYRFKNHHPFENLL